MSVQLGIYVNNRAAVFLGEKYTMDDMLAAAVRAEALGFDFVSVGDSILAKPRYMPIPVLSAIAARTSRVKLATGILQPHMRHPVLLAQDWATLDVLSGGRTVLAVGLGTGPPDLVAHEYEVIGIPKQRRGLAFQESIELLKLLWTEEQVTYTGRVFTMHDVVMGYRPVQTPHPPIVIACGGYVPKEPGTGPNDWYSEEAAGKFHGPFERVARLGDGWITGIITPEEYRDTLQLIRLIAEDRYQRVLPPQFLTVLNCFIHVDPDRARAREAGVAFLENYHRRPFDDETVRRWLIHGSPQECADQIQAYIEAGVNAFQLVPADDQPIRQMERVAETVRPLLR